MNPPQPIDWPFTDPYDDPVWTTRQIIESLEPIIFVRHDHDGSWIFGGASELVDSDVRFVSLGEIFQIDNSIGKLSSLPHGWNAHRNLQDNTWFIEKGIDYKLPQFICLAVRKNRCSPWIQVSV